MTDIREQALESSAMPAERLARSRMLTGLRGLPSWAVALIGILAIVAVWWLVSALLFGPRGSVPAPPVVLAQLLGDLVDPVYWNAIVQTSGAALLGYVWGNVVALALAFLVLLIPRSEGISTQFAVIASCIPLTAIGPIIALMSPASSRVTSVFLAALSVVFTTVVGSLLGLRAASRTQLDVVRAYGGSRYTELVKVRLIAALPSLLAALKIAAPAAFLGAVLGEYFLIGVDSGIGILLLSAQARNASVALWSIALLSGAIAGLAYFLIGLAGRLLTPWASTGTTSGAAF